MFTFLGVFVASAAIHLHSRGNLDTGDGDLVGLVAFGLLRGEEGANLRLVDREKFARHGVRVKHGEIPFLNDTIGRGVGFLHGDRRDVRRSGRCGRGVEAERIGGGSGFGGNLGFSGLALGLLDLPAFLFSLARLLRGIGGRERLTESSE